MYHPNVLLANFSCSLLPYYQCSFPSNYCHRMASHMISSYGISPLIFVKSLEALAYLLYHTK
jgi:hypothetical protein